MRQADPPPALGLRLAISAAPVALVAVVGSWATAPHIASWYATLNKPWFTPPNWLFGPAWTVLYVAMVLAAVRLWARPRGPEKTRALVLFYAQLVLNGAWSLAFFAARSPQAGLVVIVALWVMILAAIPVFWRIDGVAAGLFVPYAAWVGFATALNLAIVVLN